MYIYIYIYTYTYVYILAKNQLAPAEGMMEPSAPSGFGAFGPKTLKIFQSS